MQESNKNKIKKFQQTIWSYYSQNKRPMPWRETTDPYRIMVSEIMLQQTQVSRVIPKYEAFLEKFPDVASLSTAPLGDILQLWSGLGYNRRAINLQKAAQKIISTHGGVFPKTLELIDGLPGIGEATAGAILAYAFNQPAVFIETNIRRVFLHFFFPRSKNVPDKKLLPFIEAALPQKNIREWYYALMDYGAMLKATVPNPNKRSLHYSKQAKFAGSNRQIRGKILKFMLSKKKIPTAKILEYVSDIRAAENISDLVAEGFLKREGKSVMIRS